MNPRLCQKSSVLVVLAALATATVADAQGTREPVTTTTAAPKAAPQGVAVLAGGGPAAARDEAFTLARAVYASSLRPRALDELRARVLAGDPAPASATKEVRELADLRASIGGDDTASRRLLASIAQQLDVQGLLVVTKIRPENEPVGQPAPDGDAGAPVADAGPARPPSPATPSVVARLFVAESGDFDAARYEPDAAGTWRGTVSSVSARFPAPPMHAPATAQLPVAPPKLPSDGKESKPFYSSPWLWGALGAAVLIGGFFYFAVQDTSSDPIHLQMRVPR